MQLAPTPKDVIHREGTARLYRFRRPNSGPTGGTPLIIVPSLINRWYILDLREGSSLVGAVNPRVPTYLLDWGVPEDEDRYQTWDRVLSKLGRAVNRVRADSGAEKVAILGYCMGGTLSSIYSALEPEKVAALVNLAGPIDFSEGGMLRQLVDEKWFDPQAIGQAGNVNPHQMQSGFTALRPTLNTSKWFNYFTGMIFDDAQREAFDALEAWASDNTPFPGEAYTTYIRDLYQQNLLVKGEHHALGKRVELKRITCPVLSIVASKDTICPPVAATALNRLVGSKDTEVLTAKGGHVGAVVGAQASATLYPALVSWLEKRLQKQPVRTNAPVAQA